MDSSQQNFPITYPVVFYGTDPDINDIIAQLQADLSVLQELPKGLVEIPTSRGLKPWLPLNQPQASSDDPGHRVLNVPVTVHINTLRRVITRRGLAEAVTVDRTDVTAYPEGCISHGPSGVPYLLQDSTPGADMWSHPPFGGYAPPSAVQNNPGQQVTIAILDTFPQLDWESQNIAGLSGYGNYVRAEHKDVGAALGEWPDWSTRIETELESIYGPGLKVHPVFDRPTWQILHRYHGLIVAAICQQLVPQANFVFMRILSDNGHGYSTDLIHAIDDLRRVRKFINGPLLVNLSLGLDKTDQAGVDNRGLQRAIRKLVSTESGLTQLVCAAGNESDPTHRLNPEEPAAYGYMDDDTDVFTHVIPVAAADSLSLLKESKPNLASFSNRAPLSVPATHMLLRMAPQGFQREDGVPEYVLWAGTSFATPIMTSLIARRMTGQTSQVYSQEQPQQGQTPPAQTVTAEDIKSELWKHAVKRGGVAVVQAIPNPGHTPPTGSAA